MRNRVAELRKRANDMTQDELARKIGCSRQTVISIEQGRYDPSLKFAFRIAVVFQLPVEEVFSLDDQDQTVAVAAQ